MCKRELYDKISRMNKQSRDNFLYNNWGITLALKDLILKDENDNEVVEEVKTLYEHQKKINQIKKQELFNIIEKCAINKVKIVNFKGYTLACDIYDDIDSRISGDIDILISVEDLPIVMHVFEQEGYVVAGSGKKPTELLKDYLGVKKDKLNEMKHIKPLIKVIGNEYMKVDVHINANKNMSTLIENNFYDCAVVQYIDDKKVYVLELHDRIINLAAHFKEHFDGDYNRFVINRSILTCRLRLSLLHDIALLINKYSKVIDWNYLVKRSKALNQYRYLIFCFKIICYIYDNIKCKHEIERILEVAASEVHTNQINKMDYMIDILNRQEIDLSFLEDMAPVLSRITVQMIKDNENLLAQDGSVSLYTNKKYKCSDMKISYNKETTSFFLFDKEKHNYQKLVIMLFVSKQEGCTECFREYLEVDLKSCVAVNDKKERIDCQIIESSVETIISFEFENVVSYNLSNKEVFLACCFYLEDVVEGNIKILKAPNFEYMQPIEFGVL